MTNNSCKLRRQDIQFQLCNLSQIVFEVTDACNLKCQYCGYGDFYEDYDKRDNQFLPVEKAVRLLDFLKEFWQSNQNSSYSQQVNISFYGGEPLLNMGFIRHVVQYVEQLKVSTKEFVFSMTTNALLLHKDIDYLVEKDFKLLISLDGNEKNHSYRVTHSGENSFQMVYQNIRFAKQKYPEFFKTNVNFNSVLHNRNGFEEVYEFIKKEFGKKPRISELNNMGIRKDKEKLFMETYRNKNESLHQSENYEEIQKDLFYGTPEVQELGSFLHHYSGNVFRSYNDLLFDPDRKNLLPTGTCLPFSRKIFLTVNGKILPCERIGHQFVLGMVTDTNVILNFEDIAAKYNTWFSKLAPQCSMCHNTKACVQCIFNLDDLDTKPVCKGFMNKEIFQRYVTVQMDFLAKNPHLYKKIMEEIIIR